MVIAKQGQYGALMITEEGFFALPAFPLDTVVDPTGAGDCFAGGFMGYIAAQLDGAGGARPGEAGGRARDDGARADLDHELLAQAMAYGTALASFNVESFGVERVITLTSEEIADRVRDLRRMTHFVERPVELRR